MEMKVLQRGGSKGKKSMGPSVNFWGSYQLKGKGVTIFRRGGQVSAKEVAVKEEGETGAKSFSGHKE